MNAESLVNFFQALSSYLPSWLLWFGACIGHGFLMTTGLNVLYAWPLPHVVLKVTRKIDILAILLGPVLFFHALDLAGSGRLTWEEGSLRFLLAPYVVMCWIAGFCLAPVAQVLYWLRRQAPQVVGNEVRTVPVVKELGYVPAGRGKHRKLALLPFNQVFDVDFVDKTLALPRLPAAWDGLSILHLTDLHLCGTPDRAFYQYVIDRCMSDGIPDLVALTGDVVDSSWHHRWVVPVLGRLRWNVAAFAILGNHDAWRDALLVRRRLRKVRMNVLGNSWQQLDVRGQPMLVVGHEGPWFKPVPDLSTCPDDIFRLLLSHTPDNISWARRHKMDLMLAGHVHGGQIRLPLIGSLFVPSRYSRKYDCGTYYEAPTVMHVSRGLAGQHPVRFNCPPEVTRIILRRGNGT
jgi:predicted MPP superfamily phosphohydrolase